MSEFEEFSVERPTARALALDVFFPLVANTRTAVILLHGGGWSRGHRVAMHGYARALSNAGFVAIAAEYRLVGESAWPAQIEDVNDVIRWVRAHADRLGIDPSKIVAEGFSAGGHLALLAAASANSGVFGPASTKAGTGTALAAVVSFFAPPDLTVRAFAKRPPPLVSLLGEGGNEDVAVAASPLTYVAPGFPPTFLLNGVADKAMPFRFTVQLFDALLAAGVEAELHLYRGHTHEFSALPSMLAPVQAEVALFLRRTVVDPAHYADENLRLNPFANGTIPLPPDAS